MEESGCAPNSCLYNVIVQSLLKRNELSEAIPFMEEMCERGFSADVTTMIMLFDELQGDHENEMLKKLVKNIAPGLRFETHKVRSIPDESVHTELCSDLKRVPRL
ncbi:hypothetical protein ACS0TY_025707 [Phlomoides rotata]